MYICKNKSLIFLLFPAVLYDLRYKKIPNGIILLGLTASLFLNIASDRFCGLAIWISGSIFPVLLLGALFILKVLGAGDIKLFSLIGSFYGIRKTIHIIILAFLIGAVLSVFQMIRYKNFFIRIQYLSNYISELFTKGRLRPYYEKIPTEEQCVIHFSIAVFCSVIYFYVKGELI